MKREVPSEYVNFINIHLANIILFMFLLDYLMFPRKICN